MNFGIIAAGEGSRLVQEGESLPKPLVRIDGRPLIGRLINIFEQCGADSVNVIVNQEMKQVRDFLEELKPSLACQLNIVVKSTPSSLHSFYELSKIMAPEGRFILTTVDTVFRENDFYRYVEYFNSAPEGVDGLMAVTGFIDDEKPLYVATNADKKITGFLDAPSDDTKYVSGGIYGLSASAFPVLEKCMNEGVSRMRNFQRALVANGLNLLAYPVAKIIDVDHVSDIAKAENFLKEGN